ncbi:MAG: ATP-binding cassette domain-containing protein, partial [Planctomycetes bacterium]|nr:ATP-binding cassette domain-containing protein [Planctomycetota bacterium]
GESGCGKSVTSFSILKLLPYPPAFHPSGKVTFSRQTLMDVTETDDRTRPRDRGLGDKQMRHIRGGQIGIIFQEPMTSLNPVFTCGSQIVEAIRLHQDLTRSDARLLAIDLLDRVGIPSPEQRFREYPHQLSGGMRQRVMVAMALSCNPELLIADEPTTALDVTIQDQILRLMSELQAASRLSILLITHDLAVVAEAAHRVAVMYASKIVETTDVRSLYASPTHPYTHGLFRSVPKLGETKDRLSTIEGSVPNPLAFPSGCKFHLRCPLTRKHAAEASQADTIETAVAGGTGRVLRRCAECEPELREIRPGHWTACWEVDGYERAKATDPSEPAAVRETTNLTKPT